MNYVVELVKALAWPVTTIVIAVFFRQELRSLLGRVQKMKYKEMEAEFHQALSNAENKVKVLPGAETKALEGSKEATALDQNIELAKISPRAAIFEAWVELEATILTAVAEVGADPKTTRNFSEALRSAVDLNVLPKQWIEAIKELQALRNRVAHDASFEPSLYEARYFSQVISTIVYQLREIPFHKMEPNPVNNQSGD